MNNAIPFLHNTCLHSSDFEEAQAFLNSRIDEREVRPLTAYRQDANRFTLQPLRQTQVFGAYWGERVHIRSGALSTCHVVLPTSHSIQVRNLASVVVPNEMLLMLPGSEADLIWDAYCSAIVITFDSQALQAWSGFEYDALHTGKLKILRPSHQVVRSIFSLLQCIASQHVIHNGDIQPVLQQHWEAMLIEEFADQLLGHRRAKNNILPSHLRRVVDWLVANIEQPVTVTDLVQIADCSRRSLENGFQQFIGSSPARYILQLKLELAHQKLQQSQGTVSDIAYQCGFNHPSHFARLYKDHYGKTPSQAMTRR